MNCRQVETWLVESARGATAHDGAHADVLRHLDACPRCTARLQAEQIVTAALGALARADAQQAVAPAQTEAALLAAFRAHQSQTASRSERPATSARAFVLRPRRSLATLFRARPMWAALAAAAVVVVLLAGAALRFRLAPPQQAQTAGADSSGLVPAIAPEPQAADSPRAPQRAEQALRVAKTGPRRAPTGARKAVRRHAQDVLATLGTVGEMVVVARAAGSESAPEGERVTEFVPLVAGHAPPLASGQLVRVELPRSALASLGLPLNAARPGAMIKADVLLGDDGLARAIRLVQ